MGKKSTPFRAIVRAMASFFKMFFLKLGIFGGPITWVMCFFNCSYTLSKYMHLSLLTKETVYNHDNKKY
jgi:hypothetical protein